MGNNTNSSVIWIASYPKSGNTWLRFLLANLFFENIQGSQDVNRYIPEVGAAPGENLILPRKNPCLLKTHWIPMKDNPVFRHTLGFIYVLRNPVDILNSFFNFFHLLFQNRNATVNNVDMTAERDRYQVYRYLYQGRR